MEQAIQHGADIIIRDWVRLRAGERILIVSSRKYAVEVAAMQQAAQAVGSVADVLMLDDCTSRWASISMTARTPLTPTTP